jgi:hypothetical protein
MMRKHQNYDENDEIDLSNKDLKEEKPKPETKQEVFLSD